MSIVPRYQEYLVTDMQSLIDWKHQLEAILRTQNAWEALEYPEYCSTRASDVALGWMSLTLHPHQRAFASRFDNADELMREMWYIVTFYPGEVLQEMQDYVDESYYSRGALEPYRGPRRDRRNANRVGILRTCLERWLN